MASDSLKIVLPLPPKELSPNYTVGSRGGRMAKARKVKSYRAAAELEAVRAVNWQYPEWPAATALATFYHSQNRRRDRDNLLASLKPAFDGLVDAGVLVDDAGLTHLPVELAIDKENPRVEIEIRPVTGGSDDDE